MSSLSKASNWSGRYTGTKSGSRWHQCLQTRRQCWKSKYVFWSDWEFNSRLMSRRSAKSLNIRLRFCDNAINSLSLVTPGKPTNQYPFWMMSASNLYFPLTWQSVQLFVSRQALIPNSFYSHLLQNPIVSTRFPDEAGPATFHLHKPIFIFQSRNNSLEFDRADASILASSRLVSVGRM